MSKTKTIAFLLLTSLLILASITLCITDAQAQTQASIEVLASVGGYSDPGPGNYSYADGASVNFLATADSGAFFSYWVISIDSTERQSTDNPLTFAVTGGSAYEIQPVFTIIATLDSQVSLPPDIYTALVTVLTSAGGTTIPAPGTYAFTNLTAFNITAMPDNGWEFSHWVISGDITSHGTAPLNLEPTDNPYNVNHGYGSKYTYQAVFTQTSNPTPSPSIPEVSAIGLLFVLVAMVPVVLLMRKRKERLISS